MAVNSYIDVMDDVRRKHGNESDTDEDFGTEKTPFLTNESPVPPRDTASRCSHRSAASAASFAPVPPYVALQTAGKLSGAWKEYDVLVVSLLVCFVRYGIATFMSPFFPSYCDKHGISSTFNGLIFAAYPTGMALMSLFGPVLILRMGTKTSVLIGLVATAIMTAFFGFVPDVIPTGHAHRSTLLPFLFLLTYFVSGFIGSLSDAGVIMICGERYKEKSGIVMSFITTFCGLGCMAGPPLGGALNEIFGDAARDFRWTFVVWGAMALAVVPLVALFTPQYHACGSEDDEDDEEEDTVSSLAPKRASGYAPLSLIMTPSVAISLGAIAISGTAVASLDPTLSYRLHNDKKYHLSTFTVGLFFMMSSIIYTMCSVPVGWMCERTKTRDSLGDSRSYKLIQAAGLAFLALSYLLLGPLTLPGGHKVEQLDKMWVIVIAMLLKGVGSAGNNGVYPDLILDLPDSRAAQGRIDGLWNSFYAIGWAAGPAIGGALNDYLDFGGMSTILAALLSFYTVVLVIAAFTERGTGGHRGRSAKRQETREAAVVAAIAALHAAHSSDTELPTRRRGRSAAPGEDS